MIQLLQKMKSYKGTQWKKNPGTGGFPSQFYIFIGIEIKTILTNTILYEVENEELSIE